MKLHTAIPELRRTLALCLRCNTCTYSEWPENLDICPLYEYHKVFTASPGGITYLLRAIADKQIKCNKTMAEFAFQCTLCQKCDICEILPIPSPHVGPSDLVRFLRRELVREGFIPDALKQIHEELRSKSAAFAGKLHGGSAETVSGGFVLMVEEFGRSMQQKTYDALGSICKKMGKGLSMVDVGISLHELYDLGFWDELASAVKNAQKALKELDGKEIIFLDPHFEEFMVKRFPEISSETLQLKPVHISEMLWEALQGGELKPQPIGAKVAYHDPCHLSRGLGIIDPPRKVLSSFGVDLIEMKRNRLNTYCCGAGGRERPFPDFSDWAARRRIEEFKLSKADLLITACPNCKAQFQGVLPLGDKEKVLDLLEFVDLYTA